MSKDWENSLRAAYSKLLEIRVAVDYPPQGTSQSAIICEGMRAIGNLEGQLRMARLAGLPLSETMKSRYPRDIQRIRATFRDLLLHSVTDEAILMLRATKETDNHCF